MQANLAILSRGGAAILALALVVPLWGQADGGEQPVPAEKLVEALGAPTFAEREQAEEALRRLGEQARAALEAQREAADPEVRWRVNRLLEDLRGGTGAPGAEGKAPRGLSGRPEPSHPEQSEVEEFFRELRRLEPREEHRDLGPGPEAGSPRGRRPAELQEVEDLFRDLRELEEDLWGWELGPRGRQGRLEREMEERAGAWDALLREFVQELWGEGPGLGGRQPEVTPPGQAGPRLGVLAGPAGPALQAQLQLDPGLGLLVEEVQPGSVAQQAGVEQYDVIVGINGVTVTGAPILREELRRMTPGDEGRLTVIRQARRLHLRFRMGENER